MRALRAATVIFCIAAFASAARAGGSFDDDEPRPDQLSFFGFVRDTRNYGVGDAKVTGETKSGTSVVTRTDIVGVYRLPGLSPDTNPDDVTISCEKEGYKQLRVLRRTQTTPGIKAIEIECTMEKQ